MSHLSLIDFCVLLDPHLVTSSRNLAMDPLSITAACLSISATVPTLMVRILAFVSEVKGARKDLDGVHRELSSLQLCLNALRIEDTTGRCKLPPDVATQTCQILVNIETTMRQISNLMDKLGSGRLGRRIQWAATEKEEMNKLRSSLESNKTALEISLTLGTINLLVEQNTQTQAHQDQTVKLTAMTQQLTLQTATTDSKVDRLLKRKDNSQNIASIQTALAELKEELVTLAASTTKQPIVEKMTQLATEHTVSSLDTTSISGSAQIVQIVREIQSVSTVDQTSKEPSNRDKACPNCLLQEKYFQDWVLDLQWHIAREQAARANLEIELARCKEIHQKDLADTDARWQAELDQLLANERRRLEEIHQKELATTRSRYEQDRAQIAEGYITRIQLLDDELKEAEQGRLDAIEEGQAALRTYSRALEAHQRVLMKDFEDELRQTRQAYEEQLSKYKHESLSAKNEMTELSREPQIEMPKPMSAHDVRPCDMSDEELYRELKASDRECANAQLGKGFLSKIKMNMYQARRDSILEELAGRQGKRKADIMNQLRLKAFFLKD